METKKYNGNFGELTLNISGSEVHGSYSENGNLSGTILDNKINARWSNNGEEGLIEIELSGDELTGKWKKGLEPGPMRGIWNGTSLETEHASEKASTDSVDEKMIVVEFYHDEDQCYQEQVSVYVKPEFDVINAGNYMTLLENHKNEIRNTVLMQLDDEFIEQLQDEWGGYYLHITQFGDQALPFLNPEYTINVEKEFELNAILQFDNGIRYSSIEELRNDEMIEDYVNDLRGDLTYGTAYLFSDQ